jgi:hypothetical protein
MGERKSLIRKGNSNFTAVPGRLRLR